MRVRAIKTALRESFPPGSGDDEENPSPERLASSSATANNPHCYTCAEPQKPNREYSTVGILHTALRSYIYLDSHLNTASHTRVGDAINTSNVHFLGTSLAARTLAPGRASEAPSC